MLKLQLFLLMDVPCAQTVFKVILLVIPDKYHKVCLFYNLIILGFQNSYKNIRSVNVNTLYIEIAWIHKIAF